MKSDRTNFWTRGCSLAALGIFVLCGCQGPRMMHSSFVEYSQAYAQTSNQQMLLNLARRANGHPAYFMQMGPINASYQFGATLGGSFSHSDSFTSGGTLGFNLTEQPTFTFTPLSGSTFGNALFRPIDPHIFFSLYSQGVPGDILMRVLVQSITIPMPSGPKTFYNVIDPDRPKNYQNFLTLAAFTRALQRFHLLTISPKRDSFVMATNAIEELARLSKRKPFKLDVDSGPTTPADGPVKGSTNGVGNVSFTLRTFEQILSALANESRIFDHFVAADPTFLARIPKEERRPILRIRAKELGRKITPPVASVYFQKEHYVIADTYRYDPKTSSNVAEFWNRSVFDLLTELYVQISLDPNKLPVQQLIQIH